MNKIFSQLHRYKASFLKLFCIVVSVISPTLLCALTPVKKSPFKGIYIGGNVGYGVGFSRERFQANVPSAGVSVNASEKNGFDGIDGGINLGYTYVYPRFPIALGIEGAANWSNVKGNRKFSAATAVPSVNAKFTTNVSLKQSLQLVARMGYAFDKTMPYVKFGWDNSAWSYKGKANITSPALPTPLVINGKKNKRINGIAYGAGIDVALYKYLIAGLEYTHVDFSGQSLSLAGGNSKASFKPHTNKFALVMKVIFH